MSASSGGSVASASPPRASISRFTQSICGAESGDVPLVDAPASTKVTAATFTVN